MGIDKNYILTVLTSPNVTRENSDSPRAPNPDPRKKIMEQLVDQMFAAGRISTDQVFRAWEASQLEWLATQGEIGQKLIQAFLAFTREEKIELFTEEPNNFKDFLALVKMAEAMMQKR